MPRPQTLGELRESGWRPQAVHDEMRRNLIAKLRGGEETFPGIHGYDRTVIPWIHNAILARHHLILLGLRGQAKSRILRALPALLDAWIPAVEGCEIHDDPTAPLCARCRRLAAEAGDDLPVVWVPREERYGEKLATPDVTVADLIGDLDPIRAATMKLPYADERVMHFGLLPRLHRGIFAVNELPDLSTRIQVALLNILEEGDVQIRGFPVRLRLDVQMVFSANPEDYTNRGTIITPLRDRIESQILTHYPRSLEDSMRITDQESWVHREGAPRVHLPEFLREVVERIAIEARSSELVDQSSGVSARLTIAALEDLVSNAERRAIRLGQTETVARVADLAAALPAVTGKVELVYEGEQEGQEKVGRILLGRAVKAAFEARMPAVYGPDGKADPAASPYKKILDWFAGGGRVEVADGASDVDYRSALDTVPGLAEIARAHLPAASDEERAVAMEFVLDGLHQCSVIAKEDAETGVVFTDMLGQMLGEMRRRPPRERSVEE